MPVSGVASPSPPLFPPKKLRIISAFLPSASLTPSFTVYTEELWVLFSLAQCVARNLNEPIDFLDPLFFQSAGGYSSAT